MMKTMSFAYIVVLVFAAVTVAVPAPLEIRNNPSPPINCRDFAFNDQFDDRVAVPLGLSPLTAIGNYGALFYKTFQLTSNVGRPTIVPPTPPNFIFASFLSQATLGQPQFLLPNDTVKSFDLKKIGYACVVESGEKAFSCTIQMAGVKKATGVTVIKELVYDPQLLPAGLANTFSEAVFPSPDFDGLKEVTVSLISSAVPVASITAIIFDNVVYNACIGK